jgi:hypothetical protein
VLSGPDEAAGWLPHGGVLVLEDRRCEVVPAADGDIVLQEEADLPCG